MKTGNFNPKGRTVISAGPAFVVTTVLVSSLVGGPQSRIGVRAERGYWSRRKIAAVPARGVVKRSRATRSVTHARPMSARPDAGRAHFSARHAAGMRDGRGRDAAASKVARPVHQRACGRRAMRRHAVPAGLPADGRLLPDPPGARSADPDAMAARNSGATRSAVQALLLILIIPIYGALVRHADPSRMYRRVHAFFAFNLLISFVLGQAGFPVRLRILRLDEAFSA